MSARRNPFGNNQNQRNYDENQWENQRFNNFTKFRDHQNTNRNWRDQSSYNSYNRRSSSYTTRKRRIYGAENTKTVFDNSNEGAMESDTSNRKNESFTQVSDNSSVAVTPVATNENTNTNANALNTKKEHISETKPQQSTPIKPTTNKKPVGKSSSSSSTDSSSSSSDSEESIVKNLKVEIKEKSEKKTDNSKLGINIKTEKEDVLKLKHTEKSHISVDVIRKGSSKSEQTLKTSSNQIKPHSKSKLTSDSSDSTDEQMSKMKKVDIKQKSPSEEDVICLGKVENFENLVDDDEKCLLCDKKGHTSFFCQTICKNCGERYHNFKSCPKPANISIVLQQFMEFWVKQFYDYNPNERFEPIFSNLSQINEQKSHSGSKEIYLKRKFQFKEGGNTSQQNHKSSSKNSDSSSDISTKKRRRAKTIKKSQKTKSSNVNICQTQPIQFMPAFGKTIPLNYNSSIRSAHSSDSDSDSENDNIKKRKITKHSKKTNDINPSLFPPTPMAFISPPYNQTVPFGFGAPNLTFNPMIAFKQMMGFNPAVNFTTNSDKEK